MYLLDSNILINFLNGNEKEVEWLNNKEKEGAYIAYSMLSRIELLSLTSLKDHHIENIELFLSALNNINIDKDTANLAASMRRKTLLGVADAIIAATAISNNLTLVTNDKSLINKVKTIVPVVSIN